MYWMLCAVTAYADQTLLLINAGHSDEVIVFDDGLTGTLHNMNLLLGR